MVNKAIEEVLSEVEKEKRKLCQIEDDQYEPTGTSRVSAADAVKSPAAVGSHLAYDPGSYQITSSGYNPTPGCSKYTLDSDTKGKHANSMEYVPTSLRKSASRTHTHQRPSPPPSPKYSHSTSSSKCKYTVDNCRPSTDMEYDPLSNYSARITGKSKANKRAQAVKMEGIKAHRLSGSGRSDEEYVVATKKPRQESVDTQKYTFSESDGESSGTEYRPTSLSSLKLRKGSSMTFGGAVGKDEKEKTEGKLNALTQRNKDEFRHHRVVVMDSDDQEVIQRKDNLENEKLASRTSHEKNGKAGKVHKSEKFVNKTSSSKVSSSSIKDKGSTTKSNHDSAKKENKSHGARDDGKSKGKVKSTDKVHKEGRDEKRSDGKSRAVEKVKSDSSKQEKGAENGGKESKKIKTSDKEYGKHKDQQHKNGKLDRSKREKDVKKSSKSSSNSKSGKGSPGSSKDKVKQSISSSNGKTHKQTKDKRRTLSLSHVDLFGDESPEEAEPIVVDDDDDDEVEEVLVRKSADAFKRGRLNKRKASELTPSSSEDEGDCVVEVSGSGKDEVDIDGMDFSGFQDLDFDSDPMEECLRIFNESNDVKREDKGRQAKEVSLFLSSSFLPYSPSELSVSVIARVVGS